MSEQKRCLFLVVLVNNFDQIEKIEPELAEVCVKAIRKVGKSSGAK